MTHYRDLVERLQRVETGELDFIGQGCHTAWNRNPDGPEAAAAITALLAENERLIPDDEATVEAVAVAMEAECFQGNFRQLARAAIATLNTLHVTLPPLLTPGK